MKELQAEESIKLPALQAVGLPSPLQLDLGIVTSSLSAQGAEESKSDTQGPSIYKSFSDLRSRDSQSVEAERPIEDAAAVLESAANNIFSLAQGITHSESRNGPSDTTHSKNGDRNGRGSPCASTVQVKLNLQPSIFWLAVSQPCSEWCQK